MTAPAYYLHGVRYLTTGQTADVLGIDQRTVSRWADASPRSRGWEVLKFLIWIRDPVNQFRYFREDSVLKVQTLLLDKHFQ